MRLRVPFSALSLGLLVCGAACVGPHSSGALWSQQYVEQERAYFALTDVEHRAQAQQFELGLADDSLVAENRRLDAALQICPGPRQPLTVSSSDALRDGIRVRAEADPERLGRVAQVALADWYLRRASASGDARFCDLARQARSQPQSQPATADLLARLPAATVSRDQRQPNDSISARPISDASPLTLSSYVLGSIDAVQAAAPLPQYLALVYGGFLSTPADTEAPVDAETAATLVDQQAPAYPNWEPDALYAALRGGQP
jgi:hypothetical protein